MANKECRLRKYLRKKRRNTSPALFDKYARLYWRYHFQVHGLHRNLWSVE